MTKTNKNSKSGVGSSGDGSASSSSSSSYSGAETSHFRLSKIRKDLKFKCTDRGGSSGSNGFNNFNQRNNLIFSTKLVHLPMEVIEKIISYVNIWQRNRIRSTCRLLRFVTDTLLLHEFRKVLHKNSDNRKQTCYENVAMKIVQIATWPYVKQGLVSIFLGKLLLLLRNHNPNPFSPPIFKVKKFLFDFYKLAQEHIGHPMSLKCRLLYVVTFLSIINKLSNCEIVSTEEANSNHWRIVYNLEGSWFGVLCAETSCSLQIFNYFRNGTEILVLISILLLIVNSGMTFRVHEGETIVFVLGHDIRRTPKQNIPKISILFNFRGSAKTLEFLKLAPLNETWNQLPTEEFSVIIRIFCKEAEKWGCSSYYSMYIGPREYEGDNIIPATNVQTN